MKKTLVAALFITLVGPPLAAQTTLGFRGGVSTAELSGDEHRAERESRSGVISGIDLGIPLSGSLDVRLGLGLAQKGGATDVPPSVTAGRSFHEATAELGYLQLSTLFRASTEAERGRLKLGVLAGPYLAFNHSCAVAVAVNHPPPGSGHFRIGARQPPRTSCSETESADFRSIDFGLAFGAGLEIGLGEPAGLAFEFIYALGLSDIDAGGTRNRHLAVQSGLVFVIG